LDHYQAKASCPRRGAMKAGVHAQDQDPETLRFVDDLLPQLPKAPTVLLVALAFAHRHPASDVGQLF
jgi:hypothetical protein